MEEEDVSNESNPSMGPVDELGEFASGSSDAEAGAEEDGNRDERVISPLGKNLRSEYSSSCNRLIRSKKNS